MKSINQMNKKIIVSVKSNSESHGVIAFPYGTASAEEVIKACEIQLEDAKATKKQKQDFKAPVIKALESICNSKTKNEFITVAINDKWEDSKCTLFSLDVHSCKLSPEVKSGDKIALIFPPLCLDDFGTICESPDWIVAIKLDESFSTTRACDIFLDNCKYTRFKLDKKTCAESIDSVAWDNLQENDTVFAGYLEIAKVTLK